MKHKLPLKYRILSKISNKEYEHLQTSKLTKKEREEAEKIVRKNVTDIEKLTGLKFKMLPTVRHMPDQEVYAKGSPAFHHHKPRRGIWKFKTRGDADVFLGHSLLKKDEKAYDVYMFHELVEKLYMQHGDSFEEAHTKAKKLERVKYEKGDYQKGGEKVQRSGLRIYAKGKYKGLKATDSLEYKKRIKKAESPIKLAEAKDKDSTINGWIVTDTRTKKVVIIPNKVEAEKFYKEHLETNKKIKQDQVPRKPQFIGNPIDKKRYMKMVREVEKKHKKKFKIVPRIIESKEEVRDNTMMDFEKRTLTGKRTGELHPKVLDSYIKINPKKSPETLEKRVKRDLEISLKDQNEVIKTKR